MLKIRIYDKSDHPTQNLFWILSAVTLFLVGIVFLDSESEVSRIISYIAFGSVMLTGLLGIVQSARDYGPVGETSYLVVDEDSIDFMDEKVSISRIDKIIIRLRDNEVQYNHIGNNYLQITTRFGVTHRLAILIANADDVDQVDRMVRTLRQKVKNVVYENYL